MSRFKNTTTTALCFGLWAIILSWAGGLRADPVISELMASNLAALADDDGAFSDWLEVHNPDAVAVNLNGWYLTDTASNKTRWQFPAVTLPPGGYLLIFASNKDRRNPANRLHTNFALTAEGEYLGLIRPDGVTVAHEYAPGFPAQPADVAYGLVPTASGGYGGAAFLAKPTPGAANTGAALAETVTFSRAAGPFRDAFSLAFSGAGAGQEIRYVLVPAANGVTAAEPTANSTLYTGPIAISSSVVIRAAVFANGGLSFGPSRMANYTRVSPALAGFSSRLPVMVIDTMGSGQLVKDGIDHAAWLYSYSGQPGGGQPFAGTPNLVSPLTATVRGASSAEFPKKGYNIRIKDESGRDRAQPLLDLPAFAKWALVAPWSFDPSYINNALTYTLSNQLGRWASRTRFVELYFNANGGDLDSSDYAGIYLVTDRIEVDKGRVDVASLGASDTSGNSVTGGYVLKIDYPGPSETAWRTNNGIPQNGFSSVILDSPSAGDVQPAQLDYIKSYVQRMENALVADRASGWARRTHLDYIDRAAWIDHHILNVFAANPDSFIRSAYFFKDRNGRLAAGPIWDFDRALGSYWDDRSFRYDVWNGLGAPDVWNTDWWGIISRDPEFMQDYVDRWQEIRKADFSGERLRALVDSLGATVGTDAANRDAARWPDNASPYGSYTAQIERLRGWVTLRGEWIDRQFVAAPSVSTSGANLIITAPEGAQLAYTLDGSDPRSLGGGVAPNATVSSSPVTVAATANVHVRSYRADMREVFPGSPWSSAVGGAASSPLTPRSRLVNISSRAVVGAGENALIAGVVVADTEAKRYLSRAVGPGLTAFGASGVVPDPQLSIYSSSAAELFRNNGWETGADASRIPSFSTSVGAFPLAAGSRDSALASSVAAGAYTVQVTTPSGQPGVGLAELYELDGNGRTVNLSTRAQVRTGDAVLIGGFVVAGSSYKRMLIRAVGPTLTAFGVNGALRDPILTVYSGQTVVATNDRWEADNAAAVRAASSTAGAFALAANSEDAALLITLPPGPFTVEVRGKANTEGVALLEIYEVP